MDSREDIFSKDIGDRTATLQLHRSLLEKDVRRLKTKLEKETDLRQALEAGLGYGDEISENRRLNLPSEARELLSEVSTLENTVSKLEDELIYLRQQVGETRTQRQAREDEIINNEQISLQGLVKELKAKVYSIEQGTKAYTGEQQGVKKADHKFLGSPLSLKKELDKASTATTTTKKKSHTFKPFRRASVDDSNLRLASGSSKFVVPKEACNHKASLFSGKLYSSVDVPNASFLLGKLKSKRK